MSDTRMREMNALDYAVAELLANLTAQLALRVRNWDVSNGFSFEFKNRERTHGDVAVIIFPVGWPERACITCRFSRHRAVFGDIESTGWSPFEGSIHAHHLDVSTLNFKVNGLAHTIVGSTSQSREFLRKEKGL